MNSGAGVRAGDPLPSVYNIPLHHAFADALAAGLLGRHGRDPLDLARGIIILPNNRAVRAVADAFVRRAEGGLLLPRLVAVGDLEAGEGAGALLDGIDVDEPIPPAIDPVVRRTILARLVAQATGCEAAEAYRLAADLARTLDQLIIERVDPRRLRDAVADEFSVHWQSSLHRLRIVLDLWPAELARLGRIDLADRRNRVLSSLAAQWRTSAPEGFVVAAGFDNFAPAISDLLRVIARMERGSAILAGLDTHLPNEVWDMLGPHEPNPATGRRRPALETHPQFAAKQLLAELGVERTDVRRWRWSGDRKGRPLTTRAISNAMRPAAATAQWERLPTPHRRLSGIKAAEFSTPAEEALGIAVAIRRALEEPGRTVAVVTPDRALARRIVALLRRWDIAADDSGGRPLSEEPPGVVLLALAEMAVERFAPVPLLAVLKHPLVRQGDERLAWLDMVRAVDLGLRGPRPGPRLAGIATFFQEGDSRTERVRAVAERAWLQIAPLLTDFEVEFSAARDLASALAALRRCAQMLCGDAIWAGEAGRALADFVAAQEAVAAEAPEISDIAAIPAVLRQLLNEVAIRRVSQDRHPRVFIWGLIEARLQQADLTILAGLNEGVWPSLPAPDPWLAPGLRAALGLPGLERRIGTAAQDFALNLGGPSVLLTRARRDATAPTIASRFWLRLDAMTGGLPREHRLQRLAARLDAPSGPLTPAARPQPIPPPSARPRRISVTAVDRLKADPFAFYARAILKLPDLDPVNADPNPAWRGTLVHRVLEEWFLHDDARPDALRPRAERLLDQVAAHPVLRALWEPRLMEAVDWVAARLAEDRAQGRDPIKVEIKGEAEIAGITLQGTADRIDRLSDGSLAIVDYKTGMPPSTAQVAAGYAMQLGLLGYIARSGGFPDVAGDAGTFEYWSFARAPGGGFGQVRSPTDAKAKGGIPPDQFADRAAGVLTEAAAKWLTGNAPFTAKLHPEYAPYGEYDQLMRLEEWYGRDEG
ncbi:double-strand break repair protein AddB [Sphingomonas sp. ID0503]|uniref:double-strand break repair protein AddB n=1 Tax=Sphingomonas sp. ID0503 TaxID=3399691 RepID=UPI003AFA696A